MTEVEINVEPETEEPTMDIQEATNEEPDVEKIALTRTSRMKQNPIAKLLKNPVEDESMMSKKLYNRKKNKNLLKNLRKKSKSKQETKQEQKQKAATKIVKKMGDKGRYEKLIK